MVPLRQLVENPPPVWLQAIGKWAPEESIAALGLDSLDLVNLRAAFQKAFKCVVPLSTFTNANQTLDHLTATLCERLLLA